MNKPDYEEIRRLRNQGFAKDIEFSTTCIREGYAYGELDIQERHLNPIRSVHGGVLFTMADTIGGAAASSYGKWPTTVCGNINYVNPAINCRKLYAQASEIKAGKRSAVYEIKITDDRKRLIAVATLTYFYVDVTVKAPARES